MELIEFPVNSDGLYSEKVKKNKLRTTFRFDVDEVKFGYDVVLGVVREVCSMQCHMFPQCKPIYSPAKWLGIFDTGDLNITGEQAATDDCLLHTGGIPRYEFEIR